jgi:hypothetical protein
MDEVISGDEPNAIGIGPIITRPPKSPLLLKEETMEPAKTKINPMNTSSEPSCKRFCDERMRISMSKVC